MNLRTTMVVISLATAALSGCGGDARSASVAPAKPAEGVIRTAPAELQPITQKLEIPARVQADPTRLIHIYPPASGRVVAVEVRPGDSVRKGQTVAILQSSDVSAARSDYDKARIAAEKSHRDLERAELLHGHQVLSDKELQQVKADAALADSDLERTRDRLRVLGAGNGASGEVRLAAPRAGSVLEVQVAPGELSKSTDNSPPLITLADLSQVWVIGDVYERDLSAVKPGTPVEVRMSAYAEEIWKGKIANVSDAIDPVTRTVKVRVVLDNPQHRLKPEMFASIRLAGQRHEAIVLPSTAVLREGGDTAVMVQTAPGKYERRLVTLTDGDAKQVVIASGLKPGEVVVTEGAALVRGGGEQ